MSEEEDAKLTPSRHDSSHQEPVVAADTSTANGSDNPTKPRHHSIASGDAVLLKKEKKKKSKKEKKEKKSKEKKKKSKKHKREPREGSPVATEAPLADRAELDSEAKAFLEEGEASAPLSAADELEAPGMPLAAMDELEDADPGTEPQESPALNSPSPEPNVWYKNGSQESKLMTSTIHTGSFSGRGGASSMPAPSATMSLAEIMSEQEAENKNGKQHEKSSNQDIELDEETMLQMAMKLSMKEFEETEKQKSENVAKSSGNRNEFSYLQSGEFSYSHFDSSQTFSEVSPHFDSSQAFSEVSLDFQVTQGEAERVVDNPNDKMKKQVDLIPSPKVLPPIVTEKQSLPLPKPVPMPSTSVELTEVVVDRPNGKAQRIPVISEEGGVGNQWNRKTAQQSLPEPALTQSASLEYTEVVVDRPDGHTQRIPVISKEKEDTLARPPAPPRLKPKRDDTRPHHRNPVQTPQITSRGRSTFEIDPFQEAEDPEDEWFGNDNPKEGWFEESNASTISTTAEQASGTQKRPGAVAVAGIDSGNWRASKESNGKRPSLASASQSSTGEIQEVISSGHLSMDEAALIEKALREADEMEYRKGYYLAVQLQSEEAKRFVNSQQTKQQQGNVRTMTREEYARTQELESTPSRVDTYEGEDEVEAVGESGFRMNSSKASQEWERLDRNTVIGPNNEVRTKHDAQLQARSNAHRLGLDEEEDIGHIGNTVFNSFKQSMKSRTVSKGVATHGHGRATSDTDSTSGALDSKVRQHIVKAVNSGLIEQCNGVINEGKEAIVYHAKGGKESEGFDVAIKVFKRIQEFRGRGEYVEGDPRYGNGKFRNVNAREKLEMWAEKEYRNLVRANRACVPVPTPLAYKENIIFMRFLGEDGWAVPQLKELKIRQGSAKWGTLYSQVMMAVRRLFHGARLVHSDLSEYNILVCPAYLVENVDDSVDPNDQKALQAVLIDFGQAVDWRHPSAMEYLERDLKRVRDFFERIGRVKTLDLQSAVQFVTSAGKGSENSSNWRTGSLTEMTMNTTGTKVSTRSANSAPARLPPRSASGEESWTVDFKDNEFTKRES